MSTIDIDKFKDSKGRWRTQSLFLETTYDRDNAIYTMKPHDHDGLPSFRRLYMEISDPTEYRIATELLGGWTHWQVLCASKWFEEFITDLREELEVKLRSEGILQAYMNMYSNKSSALQAAKFFAEKKYKESRGKGRPSNEEVEEERRKLAKIKDRLEEDAERIQLHVVGD